MGLMGPISGVARRARPNAYDSRCRGDPQWFGFQELRRRPRAKRTTVITTKPPKNSIPFRCRCDKKWSQAAGSARRWTSACPTTASWAPPRRSAEARSGCRLQHDGLLPLGGRPAQGDAKRGHGSRRDQQTHEHEHRPGAAACATGFASACLRPAREGAGKAGGAQRPPKQRGGRFGDSSKPRQDKSNAVVHVCKVVHPVPRLCQPCRCDVCHWLCQCSSARPHKCR